MTLSQRYDRIMSYIVVTDEMRARVLDRIAAGPAQKRPSPWKRLRPMMTAAACVALLLLGAFTLPRMLNSGADGSTEQVAVVPDIQEQDSAEALSQAVGFTVPELEALPFAASECQYVSYWGELAEITYTATNGQAVTFRMAAGEEDVSGIYETFTDTTHLTVGELTVTLQGDDGSYRLATWTDGDYAYSIYVDGGLAQDDWQTLLAQFG